MRLFNVLLSCALVLTCTSAFSQWQWVDKDGRKVFSDRAPPPEVLEKDILKRPNSARRPAAPVDPDSASANGTDGSSPLGAAAPKSSGVDKDIEAKKKQAAEAEAAKLKAEQDRVAKAKAENCAQAKRAKATYESGVRLARNNAAGEREIIDDTVRAAELKRFQSVIDSDCN